MVRVTSVPDGVLRGTESVTVPLALPPAASSKLVGKFEMKPRSSVAWMVKLPPTSPVSTEKGTRNGVPGTMMFSDTDYVRRVSMCSISCEVIGEVSNIHSGVRCVPMDQEDELTLRVKLELRRVVCDCLWNATVSPSAFPFTRTTKFPAGMLKKKAKTSPPSRGSNIPLTSPEPNGSASETSMIAAEFSVNDNNSVPFLP